MKRKKKNTPFLDFYLKSMKTKNKRMIRVKRYSTCALCDAFRHDDNFQLITPTWEEKDRHQFEGFNRFAWGSGEKTERFYYFTPLRQTIVLFCSQLNGEY